VLGDRLLTSVCALDGAKALLSRRLPAHVRSLHDDDTFELFRDHIQELRDDLRVLVAFHLSRFYRLCQHLLFELLDSVIFFVPQAEQLGHNAPCLTSANVKLMWLLEWSSMLRPIVV
jgi:hypothetical protein